MAYASSSDVQARLGRDLGDEEKSLVEIRLEDVERMIRRRIKDLDNKLDVGAINEDDVIQVEADSVVRFLRNPEGYISETDGDYSYARNIELSAGRLIILPEEWRAIGYVQSPTIGFLPGQLQYLQPIPFSHGG